LHHAGIVASQSQRGVRGDAHEIARANLRFDCPAAAGRDRIALGQRSIQLRRHPTVGAGPKELHRTFHHGQAWRRDHVGRQIGDGLRPGGA